MTHHVFADEYAYYGQGIHRDSCSAGEWLVCKCCRCINVSVI